MDIVIGSIPLGTDDHREGGAPVGLVSPRADDSLVANVAAPCSPIYLNFDPNTPELLVRIGGLLQTRLEQRSTCGGDPGHMGGV